jgi:hypothetical protein
MRVESAEEKSSPPTTTLSTPLGTFDIFGHYLIRKASESAPHVEYCIAVTNGYQKSFTIMRAYEEFKEMFYQVKWELVQRDLADPCNSYCGFPALPPSKFCNSMDPAFISFRQELLGKFLNQIANVPLVDLTPSFLEFGSPADDSNPRIFSWESRENLFVELDSQAKTKMQHGNLTRALFANTEAYRVGPSSLEGAVDEIKNSSFNSALDEVQSAIESVVEAVADSPMAISRTLNIFDASDEQNARKTAT